MDHRESPRYRRCSLLCGAALMVLLVFLAPARASVAVLDEGSALTLVLVDGERLDTPLLARLVGAGFGSGHLFETGCEVTDAALLADRLRQTHRVIALLTPGDAALVQALVRELGGEVPVDSPAEALSPDAPLDLRALRDALGDAAQGLRAIEARPITGGAR
jgi:hypothetical protein